MADNQSDRQSTVTIDSRKSLTLTGVSDIIGFDEQNIEVSTALGRLNVEGSDMRILSLDTDHGTLTVQGSIDALFYRDGQTVNKGGFLSRLFK
ncbi:MAG: sporulation protein YabP [Clostridia bacterium]|nr:sporulation protein YabP [Clostridia bacterium]